MLSLSAPTVQPRAAILDPGLLAGLSVSEFASGVLDTICQGAEAAWATRGNHASTALGLTAIALAGATLDRFDPAAFGTADRLALQLAGHYSGRAIAIAQTSSCHAISYPLTLRLGLLHGHACGVSLGRMLRYNSGVTTTDCAHPLGPAQVRQTVERIAAALGASGPEAAAARIDRFVAGNGLARYEDLPVDPHEIAAEALAYERCHDNPRRLDLPTLTQLLAAPREKVC
jgi:alcohol dehydrogenase class IV